MVADPTIFLSHNVSVDDYERMGRDGTLAEDLRAELLDGEIVAMSPIGPKHAGRVNRINRLLGRLAGDDVVISVQNPVRLFPRSEPEPDVTLLRWRDDYYESSHPTAADVLLVIEVSDTTLARDLSVKLPIYARQAVVEVWIVDVNAGVVHVHTDPDGLGYRTVRILGAGEELVPTAVKNVRIPVADIL